MGVTIEQKYFITFPQANSYALFYKLLNILPTIYQSLRL